MGKTVLVTGGYGFLGRAAARKFKSDGWQVYGIGNGRWDRSLYEAHGFDQWFDAPVSMSALLSFKTKFDVIAHFAGNGSVSYSIANPHQDFKKTVGSTVEVLEYMRLNNPSAVLIYPSSAGVYGSKPDSPIKETDSLCPISPYGYHKKIVEELCESYSKIYSLKIVLIRFFSIYGEGLTKQLLWDASTKVSESKGESLFWGTGDETRDWLNIDDAASMVLKSAATQAAFSVMNGASGQRVTVRETLEILREELGVGGAIKFNNKVRDGDPRFFHADISRSLQLGWSSDVTLREGIRRYAKWYREFRHD